MNNVDKTKNLVLTQTGIEQSASFDIDYWTEENPKSVINLFPFGISRRLMSYRNDLELLLGLPAASLRKMVKPNVELNRLRTRFWQLYETAQFQAADKRKIPMADLVRGICTPGAFVMLTGDHSSFAWMLKPPAHYVDAVNEALTTGIDRLREVLDLDLTDADGKPITGAINAIISVTKMLDARAKGSVVQRVDIRQQNHTIKEEIGKEVRTVETVSTADLNTELALLEEEIHELKHENPKDRVIEVERNDKRTDVGEEGDTRKATEDSST